MTALKSLEKEHWDPFCQRVQTELIDPLGLDDAVVKMDRHQGMNKNVRVEVSRGSDEKSSSDLPHHDRVAQQIQLTLDELTKEVESIVDVLLQDCDVNFGKIKIEVKGGVLEAMVFSYSTRPQESTASFFLVKV